VTFRRWAWTVALALLGAILLATGIHSRATWHAGTGSEQVLTLDQLMSLVVGALCVVVAVMLLVTGLRRRRPGRRYRQR
jgi:uncharacterized membrane protein